TSCGTPRERCCSASVSPSSPVPGRWPERIDPLLAHGATAAGSSLAVALPMGVAVGAYLLAVARTPRQWPVARTVAWLGGCAAIVAALSVDEHGDPRLHMTQHVVIGMLAPVGLVLGAPVTLLLAASSPRVRRTVAGLLRSRPVHILGHPIVA